MDSRLITFIGVCKMKKLIVVLITLFFVSTPLIAFAESPLELPFDAKAEAKKHNQEFNQGHFDVALKHFDASEDIQRTGEIYFNEALAYDKLGKHGKAKIHFKEAKILANGNSKIFKF